MKEYYARRAAEYDATSWEAFDETERETVERFVASLPTGRILDIGCGTGFLTRHLRGSVVGVDQSPSAGPTCSSLTTRTCDGRLKE
jgi:SAM-dependent methyltransferase